MRVLLNIPLVLPDSISDWWWRPVEKQQSNQLHHLDTLTHRSLTLMPNPKTWPYR